VSAFYLLRGQHQALAKRSFAIASAFGLASALSVIVLGDESGYTLTDHQKMKLASIEAMWRTEEPPASFTAIGIPDLETHETHYSIEIPWVMGLIGTRSISGVIPGIFELVDRAEGHIRNGLLAYDALERIKADRADSTARTEFAKTQADLGHALLLKRYVEDPRTATGDQIRQAAWDTVPGVPSLFFTFRIMVLSGFLFALLFATAVWYTAREAEFPKWLLRAAVWAIPLPWIAAELGWFVSEFGRQPWVIDGVLPTFLAASQLTITDILITIAGFTLLYGVLAIIEVKLMIHAIHQGPDQIIADPSSALPGFGSGSRELDDGTKPMPAE